MESVVFKQEETPAEKPAEVARKEQIAALVAEGKRPAWLPENFDKEEDFAKSYAEQQATLTRAQQELAKLKGGEQKTPEQIAAEKDAADKAAADKKPEEKKADEGETPEQKAAREIVEKSGVDVSAFQKEFDDTGALSEKSITDLSKAMEPQIKAIFGKDADASAITKQWVEGQQAIIANYRGQVFSAVGGEENYGSLVAWAKTGLNAAEQKNFNEAVNSGDLNKAKLALDGLSARYTKANGKAPNLLAGDLATAVQGFASTYEMQKAISDPRYAADPVYRKSVEQRIGKSNF